MKKKITYKHIGGLLIMINNKNINTKREARELKLEKINLSGEQLFFLIRSEIVSFYTLTLTDDNFKSKNEKKKFIDNIVKISLGEYDAIINKAIPDVFSNEIEYNVKIKISDYLGDFGDFKLKCEFNFSITKESKQKDNSNTDENSWLKNLGF